jgi:hypothetical protein
MCGQVYSDNWHKALCQLSIMGGGDTVLATLVGVAAFGSKLSATNGVGVAMSVVGQYWKPKKTLVGGQ